MPLRVTIVVPDLRLSGGLKIVSLYAGQLTARGHVVKMVCGPPHLSKIRRLASAFGRSRYPTFLPSSDVRLIHTKHRDAGLVNDLPDADVLVGTWWETIEAISEAPPEKGVKVHFVQDHEVFPYLPVERARAVYRLPMHKICVSRWLLETMRSVYGTEDVSLVLNPVDSTEFFYLPRIKSPKPTVGMLYSESPRKNSTLGFEVVRKVRRHVPSLRLLAFGVQNPPREQVRQGNTQFYLRPTRPAIPEIYRSCDYWLFTSQSEGFGLPILESFAVGTPVIATRAGAAPDLVSGETGALVGHSHEDMADNLLRLLSIGSLEWSEMSKSCRAVAEANDVESAVDRLEAILMGLMRP